jgi:tetratricopeptide (TPR) repeat protein
MKTRVFEVKHLFNCKKPLFKSYSTLTLSFLFVFLLGCSTKKNKFLNREYHVMVAKYNVMYNGGLAFDEGKLNIDENYEDNYWEILPIEPLAIKEADILMPNYNSKIRKEDTMSDEVIAQNAATPFDISESKAVKTVQKHSMVIGGRERNRMIDDAYLLLGKSRYYTRRFVQAKEALKAIVKNYPQSDLIKETLIWTAKTDIRLQNETLGIESLQKMLQKNTMSDELREDAFTALALAYRQLDSIAPLLKSLRDAISISVDPLQKSRNLFVLGQLYRQNEQISKSQATFQKLVDFRKAPYKYKILSEIEKVKNFQKEDDAVPVLERLDKLVEIRENRPYLDALYFQMGGVHHKKGRKEKALLSYQNSIQTKLAKDFQKGHSYEAIGNIFFEDSDYFNAGAYYDSVLQLSVKSQTRRIRNLRKKRASLVTVLELEAILKRNDSVWTVLSMDEDQQYTYFASHIEKLKAAEIANKEQASLDAKLKNYEGVSAVSSIDNSALSADGKWYFYNTKIVGYGAGEFKKQWGNRVLEDNWRLSSKQKAKTQVEEVLITSDSLSIPTEVPEVYKVSYYLNRLPDSFEEVDSISNLRTSSYYQLALIYKEQFNEQERAAEKLESLLEIFPEDKLLLGTNYNLYKIYKEQKDPRADYYADVIVDEFPNSVFAQIISDPDALQKMQKEGFTAESRYREIYKDYLSGNYGQAAYDISDALRIFESNSIVPKFELLKAYCIARIQGEAALKKALDTIVLNYANTAEGKRAKELLRILK